MFLFCFVQVKFFLVAAAVAATAAVEIMAACIHHILSLPSVISIYLMFSVCVMCRCGFRLYKAHDTRLYCTAAPSQPHEMKMPHIQLYTPSYRFDRQICMYIVHQISYSVFYKIIPLSHSFTSVVMLKHMLMLLSRLHSHYYYHFSSPVFFSRPGKKGKNCSLFFVGFRLLSSASGLENLFCLFLLPRNLSSMRRVKSYGKRTVIVCVRM